MSTNPPDVRGSGLGPLASAAQPLPECAFGNCPPTWREHWREWHRGHGCISDPKAIARREHALLVAARAWVGIQTDLTNAQSMLAAVANRIGERIDAIDQDDNRTDEEVKADRRLVRAELPAAQERVNVLKRMDAELIDNLLACAKALAGT
jgi:hypothetical protein